LGVEARLVERRLAAILAADVAGYSRLMGANEETALRVLTGHRELFDTLIARHGGRIFNTAGDSVVAEFSSPVEAVRCAVNVQQALAECNATLPPQQRMQFRIGINLGDVMVKGADLLGDGVNVAARLEALAKPGGICLSRAIYEQVRAALPLDYQYLGEKTLKNIAQAVPVYQVGMAAVPPGRAPSRRMRAAVLAGAALAAIGAGIGAAMLFWTPEQTAPTSLAALVAKPSIAVLPFNNMSGDPQQDYFSDGMSEDLITDLSKVSGLLVIARNSTFAYKGQPVNVAQIGRELGVRYVVEGSVRKSGGRVRITAQLIDVASGSHMWAERYDRELKDIFDLQDDVRQKIVAALAVKLSPAESERLARKQTSSVEAYDLFARGLELESRFTREDNLEARQMFLRAIELDPTFARAYGKLANTYTVEVDMGWSSTAEAMANGVIYGERAVTLEDGLPEAHWTLSRAYVIYRQLPRALAVIERAVALNPSYADGLAYYALLLNYDNRPDVALDRIQQAMLVNPQHPFWYLNILGEIDYMSGRYTEAVDHLQRSLERNPNWHPARRTLIAAYGQLDRKDDAQWEIAEMEMAGAALSLSKIRQETFRSSTNLERMLDGLRKAGVSE
jgi:TolB-like protein/class 3 adenylate cyclase